MTDITINIKTGSGDSEPEVTTNTGNTTKVVPKAESPKMEPPNVAIKEETPLGKESPKEDDAKKMPALPSDRGMTEEEHAKMGTDKPKPADEAASKPEAPKEEMKDEKPSEKEEPKKMPALSSDRDMTEAEHAKMSADK